MNLIVILLEAMIETEKRPEVKEKLIKYLEEVQAKDAEPGDEGDEIDEDDDLWLQPN